MTIALATRGYICLRRGVPICGPGPTITAIEDVAPDIHGTAVVADPAPEITGGDVMAPEISGAAEVQEPPAAEPPIISGSDDMTPGIKGGT